MGIHPNVLTPTSSSSELPNISGSTGPEKIQVAPEAVQTAKDKMVRAMNQLPTSHEVSVISGPSRENIEKAEKVPQMLANGILQVAGGFVGNEAVCKSITKHFIQQIEGLEMSLRRMDIQETYGDGKNSVALGLTTLNEFLERYDFKGLGGFDRIGTSSIFGDVSETSPLGLLQLKKEAENFDEKAKAELKKLRATKGKELTPEDKARKETLEELETAFIKFQDIEEDVIKSIDLSELKTQVLERLFKLRNLAKISSSQKDINPVERMMNVSQQVSLGAWIFNDIVPAFGKDMKTNPLASLVEEGSFLGDVSKLNGMARKTPMFTEASFYANDEDNVCFLGKEVEKLFSFPKDKAGKEKLQYAVKLVTLIKKCGLRGRPKIGAKDGGAHPLVVPEQPLWNGPKDKSKALLETGDKLPETAIDTNFVPKVTARGDALPEEVIYFINEYKEYCGNFIELLQENGLLEGTEIGGFISAPSYAKFIDDAGFPTYCSVSGTTGELVCSLYCNNDTKPEIEKTLNGIRELAKNPDDIEGKNFSQFFAPIATFMEVGHFHTTAEVLGGFYSIAFALTEQEAKGKGEQPPFGEGAQRRYAMQNGFENLLIALRDHPECFLGKVPKKSTPETKAA